MLLAERPLEPSQLSGGPDSARGRMPPGFRAGRLPTWAWRRHAGGSRLSRPDDTDRACQVLGITGDTYTVTETAVPDGFELDPTVTQDVTITDNAECGSGDEDTAGPFSNDPLSEIEVIFPSLAQNGAPSD